MAVFRIAQKFSNRFFFLNFILEHSEPLFHHELTANAFNVLIYVHRRFRLCQSGANGTLNDFPVTLCLVIEFKIKLKELVGFT